MKEELLKAAIVGIMILAEWYAMQPYHEPVMGRFWLLVCTAARKIAMSAGLLALRAENNYYMVMESAA